MFSLLQRTVKIQSSHSSHWNAILTIIIFMVLSWQSDFILLHPRAVPKFAPSLQKMFEGFHTVNNKLLEQEQH